MPYLIDTDILVDYFRHTEAAANYLDSLDDWSVSVVTGLELIAGAKTSARSPRSISFWAHITSFRQARRSANSPTTS